MRNTLSISEVTYSDLENAKKDIATHIDEIEENNYSNLRILLEQIKNLREKTSLMEQGLIEHKKLIIEQNEKIEYMENRLSGQESFNLRNAKNINNLKNKIKNVFTRK